VDPHRYELISLEQHSEWYLVQFAVDGALTQAFWEHKSVRDTHPDEADFMAYLRRRSLSMLDEFGDIRTGGPLHEFHAHEVLTG
jgi:hypothetical protein